MRALTKTRLQEILTRRLKLKAPRFKLEWSGAWWNGSVISDTFRGKGDLQRVRMIHRALEAELGKAGDRAVGMLLAYTPDEWDIDLEFDLMRAGTFWSRGNVASARKAPARKPAARPTSKRRRRSLRPASGRVSR